MGQSEVECSPAAYAGMCFFTGSRSAAFQGNVVLAVQLWTLLACIPAQLAASAPAQTYTVSAQ